MANEKRPSEFISIIYNQKNDSPKYFELKKSKILLFVIGLPTITLIALVLGVIGLIHTSPFHLMDNYRQNSRAREAVAKTNTLMNQIQSYEEEKSDLLKQLADAQEKLRVVPTAPETAQINSTETGNSKNKSPTTACANTGNINSVGLSTLALFRPIQGQRDHTKPATLNLSGFKIIGNRDTINFQFNIIPTVIGEGKLAGNIIVLMKNELTIQAYPQEALKGNDTQISYLSGEPFSTQRFRPVDAGFLKPRKPGNYTFTVFIFAKNGDLLHNQSVIMPVKF